MKHGLFAGLQLLLLLVLNTLVSAETPARRDADPPAVVKDWQTWGPYRPGLYFGVRPNIPESLLMGMMWGNGNDQETLVRSRWLIYRNLEYNHAADLAS